MHCVGGAYLHLALPQARKDFARAIAAHGITEAATSPSSLRMLMQSEGELLALRSLRVGGAPLSAREVLEARERLCRNLVVTYGTQETETVAMLRADDPPGHDGRVGRLLPQVECEPVDGELRFRVPWMPDGYLDNPGADSARFRDGWFYPGDLGSLDPEGFVTLRGRVEEVINKGGVKILPAEIEAVLLAHPGVADAAVAGLAHETLGEVPVAFVVLRGETPLDALEHFCATRIDLTRLPVAFVHLEAIPRNAAGKIDRAPLRRVPLAGLISAKPPGRATRSNRP
jgi:acyl-coenzyme A synthetase/AMP-(fatty) acid ligase